ncbi:MAG: glycosyltransferase family 1 protein [Verrucomicrobiota bacterium]
MDQRIGYIDVSHTSHTTSSTGIQRVARNMTLSIQKQIRTVSPVTYDPFQDAWRTLNKKESQCLFPNETFRPGSRRRPRWTTRQRLIGVSQRPFRSPRTRFLKGMNAFDFVIFPEIISQEVSSQFQEIVSSKESPGIRIAVFHDAIAWKFPEWSARKTVKRYPEYMRSLSKLDGIAAVSEASQRDLIAFWNTIALPDESRPPVRVVYLGSEITQGASEPKPLSKIPVILCVATLEARKNHLGLLSAAAHLWHQGYDFKLELIGAQNRETGLEAASAVRRFQESGLPVQWHGATSDSEVEAAYERADFVAYPSFYEGFGLPVIEALRWGKPVVTTECGSLREVVQGGGCHLIENPSGGAIAAGIRRLLDDSEYFAHLQKEAIGRKHRSWDDHSVEILDFIEELRSSR